MVLNKVYCFFCQTHREVLTIGATRQIWIFPGSVITANGASNIPTAFVDVKTMIFRPRSFFAQMPFAGKKSFVTSLLHGFGQCGVTVLKMVDIVRREQFCGPACIAPIFAGFCANPVGNAMPCREFSGENTGSRGAANLAGGIAIGKQHPFAGNTVDVGRFIILTAHYAAIGVAIIVNQNKKNIGF